VSNTLEKQMISQWKNAHLIVGLAALLLAAGCSKQSANANSTPGPQALPVKVAVVQAQLVPEATEYLATLKSRNASALQPQVEGEVTKIFVHSGDRVNAGASILEIDPQRQQATVNNQEASYRSKQATLDLNRIELERRKKLYAAGVIAKADLDTAQSAYDVSRADLEALHAGIREQQVTLHYYTVRAPTAGIIGDIPVHVGDRVSTLTLLTTLDRGGELEAYVYVPAEKSAAVHSGIPIELLDDQGKAISRSKVFFVSPQVDTTTQTVLLKAAVPNANHQFRNDQTVHARVIWSERKSPLIPMTAVARLSGKTFAFVAEGSGQQTVARQKVVELGDLIGADYVVLNGIQPGDRLITSGTQMLVDGMPVAPQS
jgi:RND family efflux transporter MFP subunit